MRMVQVNLGSMNSRELHGWILHPTQALTAMPNFLCGFSEFKHRSLSNRMSTLVHWSILFPQVYHPIFQSEFMCLSCTCCHGLGWGMYPACSDQVQPPLPNLPPPFSSLWSSQLSSQLHPFLPKRPCLRNSLGAFLCPLMSLETVPSGATHLGADGNFSVL